MPLPMDGPIDWGPLGFEGWSQPVSLAGLAYALSEEPRQQECDMPPILEVTEFDTGIESVEMLANYLDRTMGEIQGMVCDLDGEDIAFCERRLLQLLADLKARKASTGDPLDDAVEAYKAREDKP